MNIFRWLRYKIAKLLDEQEQYSELVLMDRKKGYLTIERIKQNINSFFESMKGGIQ